MAERDVTTDKPSGGTSGSPDAPSSKPITNNPGEEQTAPLASSSDPAGQQESYHTNVGARGDSAPDASSRSAEAATVPAQPSVKDDWVMEDNFSDAMRQYAKSLSTPVSWNDWQIIAKDVGENYPMITELKKDPQGGLSAYLSKVRKLVFAERFGSEWMELLHDKGIPVGSSDSAPVASTRSAEGRTGKRAFFEPAKSLSGPPRPTSISPSPPSPSQELVDMGLKHISGPLEVIRDEHTCDGTETSSAFGERLEFYGQGLAQAGEGQVSVDHALAVERMARAISKEHVEKVRAGTCEARLQSFCCAVIDAQLFLDEDTLPNALICLRANARLAQMSVESLQQAVAALPARYHLRKEADKRLHGYVEVTSSNFASPDSRITGDLSGPATEHGYAMVEPNTAEYVPRTPERRSTPVQAASPGPSPSSSQAELAQQIQLKMIETLDKMNERSEASLVSKDVNEAKYTDKANALVGIKFEQTLPIIKDSDPDFDTHWRRYYSAIQAHSFGRQGVRPWDIIQLIKKTLHPGSTRLMIYNMLYDRAERTGRFPDEAKEVLEEMKIRLRDCIKETSFQKEERLEREMNDLTFGNKPHAEFQAQFEVKLDALENAGLYDPMSTMCIRKMFRLYISKIPQEFRAAVLSRQHQLDGPNDPLRKPETWREVAECVEVELSSRADIRAPKETMHALDDGIREQSPRQQQDRAPAPRPQGDAGQTYCRGCKKFAEHSMAACPAIYAKKIGEDLAARKSFDTKGGKCRICEGIDHFTRHHDQAYNESVNPGKSGANPYPPRADANSKGKDTKGKGKDTKGKGKGKDDKGKGKDDTCRKCGFGKAAHANGRYCTEENQCRMCGKSKESHADGRYCKAAAAEKLAPIAEEGSAVETPKRKLLGNGRETEKAFALYEDTAMRLEDQLGCSPEDEDAAMLHDMLCWAQGLTPQDLGKLTAKPMLSMEQIFIAANKTGLPTICKDLDELGVEEFTIRPDAKPAGYASQTALYFGTKAVSSMLDSCATCSAMPMEMLILIISHAHKLIDEGLMTHDSPLYPLSRLEKYENTAAVQGVEGAGMMIRYGAILRAEFVPIGGTPGNASNPTREIYFKILPMGAANITGVLIGNPTLDCAPHGLGWERKPTSHFFADLQLHLPRVELKRRAAQIMEIDEWNRGGNLGGKGDRQYLTTEQCSLLKDQALCVATQPSCFLDHDDVNLGPGEQAIVPALWTGLNSSHASFLCCAPLSLEGSLDVIPGLCHSDDQQTMLCVSNPTLEDIIVSRGDVLALGFEAPSGTLLERRHMHPKKDQPRDGLVYDKGEWQQGLWKQPEPTYSKEYPAPCNLAPIGVPVSYGPGGHMPETKEKRYAARSEKVHIIRESPEILQTDQGVCTPLRAEDEVLLRVGEDSSGAASATTAEYSDKLYHLVQEEPLIASIHDEEIPPDEYYEMLTPILREMFPECRPEFIDHVVSCCWAFDTAAAFALSFGIKKFQLAQHRVKYVGEIVGREGRSPNPDLCRAIREWPPINNLKDLQGFLGTTNYGRLHAGPSYAHAMAPLRPLLGKDPVFPMNESQLAAIEKMKTLILESHVLAVPDERAAIAAAHAWQNKLPAAGHPYEGVADTSKIAAGGAFGQAREKGGKLRFLLYWSGPLTAAQSQWHPFEQELYGLLMLGREIIKHFGRIAKIFHTDHGTITRLEYLPLERVDAKHYRWYAELTQSGDLILYNPGTSVLHKVADGLSREPPRRDELNLARIGDWNQMRRTIRGVQTEIDSGQYDDEEPVPFNENAPDAFPEDAPYPPCPRNEEVDLMKDELAPEYGPVELVARFEEELEPNSSLPSLKWASPLVRESIFVVADPPTGCLPSKPLGNPPSSSKKTELCVLFLPPYCVRPVVDKHLKLAHETVKALVGDQYTIHMIEVEPTYSDDAVFDPTSYWVKPHEKDADKRRRLLRKQLFAGIVGVLGAVSKYNPSIIIGSEQGGLIALLMARCLVLEAACRARILTSEEMRSIREAWCRVVSIIGINPIVLPQRTSLLEVQTAVPECAFAQPKGQHRLVLVHDTLGGAYKHVPFSDELGMHLGVVPSHPRDVSSHGPEVCRLLTLPVPVYLEDDVDGCGVCSVCGKRGSFGRCTKCGLLAHESCFASLVGAGVANVSPSGKTLWAINDPVCPRCVKTILPEPVPGQKVGLGKYDVRKELEFGSGSIAKPLVGKEKGLDFRGPCLLHERPTDEEAKKHGFDSAQEWYQLSAGGHLLDPAVIKKNFDSLPMPALVDEDAELEPAEDMQWWRYLNGASTAQPEGGPLIGETFPPTSDITALLAEQRGHPHPYLMTEVEPLQREKMFDMRESLSEQCQALWRRDAEGVGQEVVSIPDPGETEGGKGIRLLLKEAQRSDVKLKKILDVKVAMLDPAFARTRKTGEPKEAVRLSSLYTDSYRLAPTDGVLEFRAIFTTFVLWVPICPNGRIELAEGSITWKEWMWQMAHGRGVDSAHRSGNETFQILKRMTFWESMPTDSDRYYRDCTVCLKYRSHPVQGPYRSILADPASVITLPWSDVIIDMQGPFTKAEGGEAYVMAYHCSRLKVPLLETTKTLDTGQFSRALIKCVLRARKVPDVMRTDRGPEMVNKVNTEINALCGIKQLLGAALTPRHQGLGERGHQTMILSLLILMKEVVKAFPQEWASLVPAVEHLMHTAPQGSHGISAHDLSCAWGIASSTDSCLAPFRVPAGLPETDVASKLFDGFRGLMGVFTRATQEAALKAQMAENKTRVERTFEKGEVVFRKLPSPARMSKHLFPAPCTGPYQIEEQPRRTSVILRDPKTGILVNNGAYIPLEQIIAGPRRAKLIWPRPGEEDSPERPLSEMVAGNPHASGEPLRESGFLAGRTRGWGPICAGSFVAYQTILNGSDARDLTIGKILVNHRGEQQVTLQPYSNEWERVRVVHRPQYQTTHGYTTVLVTSVAKETIRYEAMVLQVELLVGGELAYSSARRLSDRGWGLLIEKEGEVAHVLLMGKEFSIEDCEELVPIPATGYSMPKNVYTELGPSMEMIRMLSQGKLVDLERSALACLQYGERIAFLELFCGMMMLTLGVRAHGLKALDGWDALYRMGDREWDFADSTHQKDAKKLVRRLDPVVLHTACPCQKFSKMALHPSQANFSQTDWDKAVSIVEFSIEMIEDREKAGGAGSLENPKGSRLFGLKCFIKCFGTQDKPKKGRYFASPDLCAYGAADPVGDSGEALFYHKPVVLAATYVEILQIDDKCPGDHEHVQVRGSVKGDNGKWIGRGLRSGAYTAQLGLEWGRIVAAAVTRLARVTAQDWVERQVKRQLVRSGPDVVKEREDSAKPANQSRLYAQEEVFIFRDFQSNLAYSLEGSTETVFHLPEDEPADLPDPQELKASEPMKEVSAAEALAAGAKSWARPRAGNAMNASQLEWMNKLKAGDLSGVCTPDSVFIPLPGATDKTCKNPRTSQEYKMACLEAVGLGTVADQSRYGHLEPADIKLLKWLVARCSSCMWLPDTGRTMARGFKHRLITKGPAVRVPLHRLSRPDQEWVEQAIKENVDRGQLKKGNSAWGFPAFPTKETAAHKSTQRSRRLVIDYRALNRVTVRKVFLIPNSDALKSIVAGSQELSVGDLKEGFNQCQNEPETSKKLAVLVASGCYLPEGLTFGPTNGPEDFQELVFIVFSRRLYREWFLFLDDLTVATGRPGCLQPGPSGVHDVLSVLRTPTSGEDAAAGKTKKSGAARGGGSGNGTNPVCWTVQQGRQCHRGHACRFSHDLTSVHSDTRGAQVCWEYCCHDRCERRGCDKLHDDAPNYNGNLVPLAHEYDDTTKDWVLDGRLKVVCHTAGVDVGGVPEVAKRRLASTTYIGNGSPYNFRNPGTGAGGRRYDAVYDCYYSNAHTGGCGFMQKQMVEAAMPGALLSEPEAFYSRIVPGTTLYMLCKSICEGLTKCVESIMSRYYHGVGDLPDMTFVAGDGSVCQKGHHRSLFRAMIEEPFARELGFSTGLRQHHARPIPGMKRDKEACGCGTQDGCKLSRKSMSPREYDRWEAASEEARADVYRLLRRVLCDMLPEYPQLKNCAIPGGPASAGANSWELKSTAETYIAFPVPGDPVLMPDAYELAFPQTHGRARGAPGAASSASASALPAKARPAPKRAHVPVVVNHFEQIAQSRARSIGHAAPPPWKSAAVRAHEDRSQPGPAPLPKACLAPAHARGVDSSQAVSAMAAESKAGVSRSADHREARSSGSASAPDPKARRWSNLPSERRAGESQSTDRPPLYRPTAVSGKITYLKRHDGVLDDDLVAGAIVQQANCIWTEPAGLARGIANKHPYGCPYKDRKPRRGSYLAREAYWSEPGTIDVRRPPGGVLGPVVINCFAQWKPGRTTTPCEVDPPEGRFYEDEPTRERWFLECLNRISKMNPIPSPLHFPESFACGLGGGKREHYHQMLERFAWDNQETEIVLVTWTQGEFRVPVALPPTTKEQWAVQWLKAAVLRNRLKRPPAHLVLMKAMPWRWTPFL